MSTTGSQVSMPSTGSGAAAQQSHQMSSEPASKPKPCCVCKDEKARRDECMLFSNAPDPAKDCASMVDQYRSCMAGYGFKV